MNKKELLKQFEKLHRQEKECDEDCTWCEYLEICDITEQLLERKIEQED